MILMNHRSRLLSLTTMLGVGVLSGSAIAQAPSSDAAANRSGDSLPQITIEASHHVHKKQVGVSYTGIPIEQVTLSRHVSYKDLNLNTPAGAAELDKRIKATAQEACDQLKTLYPLDSTETDNRQCVSDAMQRATQQAKNLEASRQGRS